MALHRGIQSAIFYYVSCAPCADARVRRKRRKEAERDRADKDHLATLMPDLYRHPSPSSTNPYWQADIVQGPLPVKGKRKTNTTNGDSQKGGRESKQDGSIAGSAQLSSVDLPRIKSRGSASHDGGGSQRHAEPRQRQDEQLWGSAQSYRSAQPPLPNGWNSSTVSSIGLARPATARTRDSVATFRSHRNPQINELHPATVTVVGSTDEIAWMLQPPPVAEVMEGLTPPPRARSMSGTSKLSMSSGAPMSRRASSRYGENVPPSATSLQISASPSRDNLARPNRYSTGKERGRGAADLTTDERDFADSPSKREKRKPSPIHIPQESEDSGRTIIHRPMLAPEPLQKPSQPIRKASSRPQLSTILSDSLIAAEVEPNDFYTPAETPKDNFWIGARVGRYTSSDGGSTNGRDRVGRRSPIVCKDGDFLSTRILATSPRTGDSRYAQPLADGEEAVDITDSWYTPELDISQWVHEQTKREGVKRRQSMDDRLVR
ncbi:hypothetical protein Tdes44962_MAKER06604 [Teratosphaeria destructans]|uniref:Uncharacterized protein n=1 Tax=Teratosphaeria destructans TaxID=418781 RepID=A0A9W7W6W9_9PEZI|nr:hypothetical protein Tdes44962_MAKER06604 [Teratosphaeria destructans]